MSEDRHRTYVGVAYSSNQSTAPVCTQLALSDANGYLAFPTIFEQLNPPNCERKLRKDAREISCNPQRLHAIRNGYSIMRRWW
jgi:hypothetical protein